MPFEAYLAPDQKHLISRFWQSASGFWRGPSAWRAWLLVALLIATVLLQLLVQYRLNYWNRDFFNAIERKDGAQLWDQALIFMPLAAASLSLAVLSVWSRMTMQRTWRAWLSNHLYDYWLERGHQRQLQFISGEHQNPEYRIAEDAQSRDRPAHRSCAWIALIIAHRDDLYWRALDRRRRAHRQCLRRGPGDSRISRDRGSPLFHADDGGDDAYRPASDTGDAE